MIDSLDLRYEQAERLLKPAPGLAYHSCSSCGVECCWTARLGRIRCKHTGQRCFCGGKFLPEGSND